MSFLQVITIFEEGEPLIDGEPGDLKFIVKTAEDPKFVRQKDDLWFYQTISLEQALIGFTIQVSIRPPATLWLRFSRMMVYLDPGAC